MHHRLSFGIITAFTGLCFKLISFFFNIDSHQVTSAGWWLRWLRWLLIWTQLNFYLRYSGVFQKPFFTGNIFQLLLWRPESGPRPDEMYNLMSDSWISFGRSYKETNGRILIRCVKNLSSTKHDWGLLCAEHYQPQSVFSAIITLRPEVIGQI